MSDFIIVRPVRVTEANLVASNIPENDAPLYDAEVTYNLNDEVIFSRRVYRALTTVTGVAPDVGAAADPPTWFNLRPTNRYRIFDTLPAPQSVRAGGIDITVSSPVIANAVGLINVRGNSVTVQVINPDEGIVYSATRSLQDNSQITDLYAFFFEPISFVNDLVFLDLPNFAGDIRVIVNAGNDTAALGEVIIGRQQVLGLSLFGTSIGLRDFSRIQQDEFGDYQVVRRRFAKTADYDVSIDNGAVAGAQRALSSIRALPTLIIGSMDREETIIYGLCQEADIVLSGPVVCAGTIRAESLPYEELETLFSGGAVSLPEMIVPTGGGAGMPNLGAFRSTPFASVPGDDTHANTSWQFSETEDFAAIFHESLDDEINLVTYTPPSGTFTVGDTYWGRLQHRGIFYGPSAMSTPISFVAGVAASVTTPSVTAPAPGGFIGSGASLASSAFASNYPASTHKSSRWRISTNVGMTGLVADVTSQVQLTEFAVPDGLTIGATYYVDVSHADIFGTVSTTSAVSSFVYSSPRGQAEFTTPGVYEWVCPPGVTSISAVAVGGGASFLAGGYAAALSYCDQYQVTPGRAYQVVVGRGGLSFGDGPDEIATYEGRDSYLVDDGAFVILGGRGRIPTDDDPDAVPISGGVARTGGGIGGRSGRVRPAGQPQDLIGGGGGAPGYSGNGGDAGRTSVAGQIDGEPGEGGGGGGGYSAYDESLNTISFPGGGVGIYGEGVSGDGGTALVPGGRGGSDGEDAVTQFTQPRFGAAGVRGGGGAVRIIWGTGRAYPSTLTADE